jgi:hypothetical protein
LALDNDSLDLFAARAAVAARAARAFDLINRRCARVDRGTDPGERHRSADAYEHRYWTSGCFRHPSTVRRAPNGPIDVTEPSIVILIVAFKMI